MRLVPYALVAFFTALIGLLSACGTDDKSGACTGTMDGTYFRFEVANYLDSSAEVRINGRFVGSVNSSVPNTNGTGVIPGVNRGIGIFPVCDNMVIDFRGQNITSKRLCATPIIESAACRAAKSDYCWVAVNLLPSDGLIPAGSDVPPPDSPACDPASGGPAACTGAFTSC